jgi:FKBP-type peptidyl-prolyl cis-trans isomerase FklB
VKEDAMAGNDTLSNGSGAFRRAERPGPFRALLDHVRACRALFNRCSPPASPRNGIVIVALVAAASMCLGFRASQPAGTAPAADPGGAEPAPADVGYSVGFSLGREVRTNTSADGVQPDAEALIRGFSDAVKGATPSMTEARINQVLAELQKAVDARKAAERMRTDPVFRAKAEEAASRSATFLKRFAERSGVVALPSGIEYQVMRAGDGPPAADCASVIVNYEVFLTNGDRVSEGQRREVNPDALVPGAAEVLKRMKQGDRWYAAIPAQAAFGTSGHIPDVGPNEALVIDVEVIEVKK